MNPYINMKPMCAEWICCRWWIKCGVMKWLCVIVCVIHSPLNQRMHTHTHALTYHIYTTLLHFSTYASESAVTLSLQCVSIFILQKIIFGWFYFFIIIIIILSFLLPLYVHTKKYTQLTCRKSLVDRFSEKKSLRSIWTRSPAKCK